MAERIYNGPLARGRVWLPTREVPFVRGEPIEVDADEAKLLGDEWSTPKSGKSPDKTSATDKES